MQNLAYAWVQQRLPHHFAARNYEVFDTRILSNKPGAYLLLTDRDRPSANGDHHPLAPRRNAMSRPPLPPFTRETAIEKVRLAEDGWNSRDAAKVALAYTLDTRWRNRVDFATNRDEAQAFLTRKWNRELEYRLIKELWAFTDNRIAVRYAYEYRDDSGQWFRAYGNENWEFAADGLMQHRHASINEMPIKEEERKFRWPLGRRPDDHPSLSDFGF